MNKREREVRALADKAGVQILACTCSGGGHIKAEIQACDGRKMVFVLAASPSDYRADKNNLARMRRFSRGHGGMPA